MASRVVVPANQPHTLASGSGVSVSTTTTLLDWFDGSAYGVLLFVVENLDPVNPLTIRLRTSEGGVRPDGKAKTLTVGANGEDSIEVGPSQVRRNYLLDAYTASPTFPTVSVNWSVVGLRRR